MGGLFEWLVRRARPYWFRGKGRLFKFLVNSQNEVSAEIWGCRFGLDLKDTIQRDIYLGTFEPQETRMVSSYLRPGMTFFDVGANVGYYTALAAQRVGPSGRVYAFEPSPYAYSRLEKMVQDSALTQVTLCPFALGENPGKARLVFPEPGNHTPSLLMKTGKGTEVDIRTLDSCLAEWNSGPIDLMKIDVEGFEFRVLRGAREALQGGVIRSLLCEFNASWLQAAGTSPQELFDFICAQGFTLSEGRQEFVPGGNCNLFFVRR